MLPQGEDSGKAVQEESKIMGDMLTRFRFQKKKIVVLALTVIAADSDNYSPT